STIIFKVPHRLREVNEKAYEPNVISIGPYHYRKPHLARMEEFKKRWFKKFVEKPHLGIDQFREAIRPLEEKIHNCYEQPLPLDYKYENLDKEKFVDMMVYDGCFVVQLILAGHLYDFSELGRHISAEIFQDLLLLE
ncbi:hypothetical protein Goklo_001457, partial [Gossypium klotzschianum]|nr:hypothetical protein [Gossypium klotzschianum]